MGVGVVHDMAVDVPNVLWITAGFMLLLYWIELQQQSGMNELSNVRKLRPILFVIISLSLVIVLPLSIWESISGDTLSTSIYFAGYIVLLLILMILCIRQGWKLTRVFKDIWNRTKVRMFKVFLAKV